MEIELSDTVTLVWRKLYQDLIKKDTLMAVVATARMGRRYISNIFKIDKVGLTLFQNSQKAKA